MIYQNTQADEVATPQQSAVMLHAGMLFLLRGLTAVAMLAALMMLAQAGLGALPWSAPLPGILLALYVLCAGVLYLATLLSPAERYKLTTISFFVDLAFLIAISYYSGGALAPFALIPAFTLSVHRNIWSGLIAFAVFALHLPLIWSPTNALTQLNAPGQMLMLILMLLVILFWLGLSSGSSQNMARDVALQGLQGAKLSESQIRRVQLRAKSLYNVSYIISSTLSFQSAMQSVFEELRHVLTMDAGVALLIDPATNKLAISSFWNLTKPEQSQVSDLRNGQIGRAIGRGAAAIINDLSAEEELLAHWPRLAACSSAIVVPLRARFELFGVLLVFRQNGRFDQSDLELLNTIGNNAVMALQNAQLYQHVRDERDKLAGKEDEVRRQVARDLHDGPAQTLALISMKVEFIKKLLDLAPESALRELDTLGTSARKANHEVRDLLFGLRPALLESHGLQATLASYIQRFPPSELPVIHLQEGDLTLRLTPAVETAVFNVAQEAIANARKHARARNIWVSLGQFGGKVVLSVQDDGQGFDINKTSSRLSESGIMAMYERAASVDGELNITAEHGRGTNISLMVPVAF